MDDKQLKKCPFCGGEAKAHSRCSYEETGGETMFFVRCKHCGVNGPWSYSKENAINEWNTRKPMENIIIQLEITADSYTHNLNEERFAKYLAYNRAIEIVKKEGLS